jgi:hypothetical protein
MMKYFEALKIYNDGKPAWCSPRKGTKEYKNVIAIMNGKSPMSPKPSPKSPPKLLFKRSNIVKLLLSVR